LDWEEYWEESEKRFWYNLIATFYRKFVIKRNLNFYIRKYVKKSQLILHAGAGSGEVDKDIVRDYKIFALDISKTAFIKNKTNKYKIRADLFSMPFKTESFHVVYNLGVLEHFHKQDIIKILKEKRRILKKDGILIIFWPPEYGMSVCFFKLLRFLFRILGIKKIFHPAEPSRLKSRKEAENIFEESGFMLIEYYFGIRDLLTYAVLVGKRL